MQTQGASQSSFCVVWSARFAKPSLASHLHHLPPLPSSPADFQMDEEGWSYAVDFAQNFGPKRHTLSLVRRRRWLRVARRRGYTETEKQAALLNLSFLVLLDESKF